MQYQIREIVDVAHKIQALDPSMQITWENIGDPIKKGWDVPPFLKTALHHTIDLPEDRVFAYAHSRGLPEVRAWIVDHIKKIFPDTTLDPEYVLFTSGLGSAIASLYHMLPDGVRILQPAPAYPTHSSFESFRTRKETLSYRLDPDQGWEPDVVDMEAKLQAHPEIGGILLINPNNPTGAVYSVEVLEKIVALAEKYGVMLISDEVYFRMVYHGHVHTHVMKIAEGRVPLVVMRGMSKDVPWPGGRCGWLEFHGVELDEGFRGYAEAMKKRIMMEVCSTTIAQTVLPNVYDHAAYPEWLRVHNAELEKNSTMIHDILSAVDCLDVNMTNGAFYMMPLFKDGVLNNAQSLPIENDAVRAFVEEHVADPNIALDKRFAYYLLASTGICIVPATGFFSERPGFRLTTLDRSDEERKKTYETLARAVRAYVRS